MPSREELLGYLLGALDASEQELIEYHLQHYPDLEAELHELKACMEPLAELQSADVLAAPPAGLARRTVEQVARAGRTPSYRVAWGQVASVLPSPAPRQITPAAGVASAAPGSDADSQADLERHPSCADDGNLELLPIPSEIWLAAEGLPIRPATWGTAVPKPRGTSSRPSAPRVVWLAFSAVILSLAAVPTSQNSRWASWNPVPAPGRVASLESWEAASGPSRPAKSRANQAEAPTLLAANVHSAGRPLAYASIRPARPAPFATRFAHARAPVHAELAAGWTAPRIRAASWSPGAATTPTSWTPECTDHQLASADLWGIAQSLR